MIRPQAMRKGLLIAIFGIGMISTYAIPTLKTEANLTSPTDKLQKYVEVEVSNLPQPVIDVVAKYFEGATIHQAYTTEKGEFKLVISTVSGANQTLHANSEGRWI